ncbi:hypothetical protein FACS1894168_4000 [Deltaproteobacteria bacterium]|nr:hypothetical protein FACS1894168_4000 [Deltaproteobacteria bacterium]
MEPALKEMISSMTEGRIRLRSPHLRDANLAHRLAELAVNIRGMLEVTVNPLVGSALFLYDPTILQTQELLAHAEKLVLLFPPPPSSTAGLSTPSSAGKKRVSRKNAKKIKHSLNAGMALSLLSTIGSGYLARRIHPRLGWMFVGFTMLHYLQTRK